MDNKTISCPFCFTQSPHGVRVCKGCHAKVAYGESPLSADESPNDFYQNH